MIWLIVAVAVGILLALIMLRFGMRRSILVLGGAMLAGVVALIWYAEFYDNTGAAFPEQAVDLQNFTVTETGPGRYQLNARIFNKEAERTLPGFGLRILAKDCSAKGDCIVIGDQSNRFDVQVPAGQARDIQYLFEFANLRPTGKLEWGYRLLLRE